MSLRVSTSSCVDANLLGCHVEWGTDDRAESRVKSSIGQRGGRVQCLGQAEVNDFGHRLAVVFGDQQVAGFQVAVDDPFLMRVLDGRADPHKQFEAGRDAEPAAIAVFSQRPALHQLHDEIRTAAADSARLVLRRAAVEDPGDVGVVHQGERLALGLEPGQDSLGVHSGLDQLEGNQSLDGVALLGHPDGAHAAFADRLEELIAAGNDRADRIAVGDWVDRSTTANRDDPWSDRGCRPARNGPVTGPRRGAAVARRQRRPRRGRRRAQFRSACRGRP